MKLTIFALSSALSLALPSTVQAKSKPKSSGGSSGTPDSPDYAQNRAKVYHTLSFDGSPCVKDPSPAKFGQYGCCADPGSLPQFAKGWNIQFLEKYDAQCLEPINGDNLVLKFKVVAEAGAGLHDPEFIFGSGAFLGDENQQAGTLTPLCVGLGEEKTYTIPSTVLLRNGDVFGTIDSSWGVNLVALPQRGIHPGSRLSNWGSYTNEKTKTGGPWFTDDCKALADRIRAGKVKLDLYPENAFALEALGGKAPGGGSGGQGKGARGGKL